MELIEEIQSLINLKTEGEYWDFKEKWHENNARLLHDIICMANNQVGRDAYIIIGVSDKESSDGVKVKGVPNADRKDQQKLIDFLNSKKFAGDCRPSVYLQTLQIPDDNNESQPVDVIIIKNSVKTPFFLAESYPKKGNKEVVVRAGYIYTRVGDTNTPIDSIADMDKIEYLWRKRFGIDLSACERLSCLLDEPDDWIGNFNGNDCKYHKRFPEFQIHINDIDDQSKFSNNRIISNIASHQFDKDFLVSEVVITYHSTTIFRGHVLYLDGCRYLIPLPKEYTVYKDINNREKSLTYAYLNAESIEGKLFYCFALAERNWYHKKWDKNLGIGFLFFGNSYDKEQFDKFVQERLEIIDQEFAEALMKKGYSKTTIANESCALKWSKINEIKSRHLFEQYKGICNSRLIDKIPNPPN